ncbi:hypothetical protein [Caproicibacter fermentans]|uniref:Uncharacterized protein n=1 Tax=Caproicibacter fermentans TaxID=2576756 RepID=A0A7G8TD40_9FIRM|nr:hypothetical protein [Caproicibacter fermentans]QNK41531.1 hypothetical protein HCR03_04515 [Caproicibacter fermentans]
MIQRYIKLTKLTPGLLNMVDDGRLPVMVGVELAYLLHADLEMVSSYLLNHPQLEVSVNQAGLIRKLCPVSIIELDHLFFPCESEDEPKEQKLEKKAVSPVSVSIKIDDLKDLGCDFDFEESSKADIREFILESLNDYFQQSD